MSECIEWKENSDNRLTVVATDEFGAAITDAAVIVTIYDSYNNQIEGVSWPQDMVTPPTLPPLPDNVNPVLASVYSIVFPKELDIVADKSYYAVITLNSPTAGWREETTLIAVTN